MSNINGVGSGSRSGGVKGAKKAKSTQAAAKSRTTQSTDLDQLELSADAVLLNDLQQALMDAPEVDVIKVEEIRQAIKDGKLPLNREQLAEKMLELHSQEQENHNPQGNDPSE
ncbi:flagellar biosynthesis anti-sigma factor FlgM [Endozoicomonas arenosclerae]|uniref:flagellar biosynthesis anti-sigma factor FlgM n=1 Tax=Endozoicomonas arenosclerae TaxID=1633495 RepID=UPI00078026C9|nr:flagellar biosynthesis anti-sigma factor FlgM [Endozoicomonas arenosclerae]